MDVLRIPMIIPMTAPDPLSPRIARYPSAHNSPAITHKAIFRSIARFSVRIFLFTCVRFCRPSLITIRHMNPIRSGPKRSMAFPDRRLVLNPKSGAIIWPKIKPLAKLNGSQESENHNDIVDRLGLITLWMPTRQPINTPNRLLKTTPDGSP